MSLPELANLRNILIIRRDNIGDLVCTTPLITGLRNACPQAHISVLVNSYNEAVLHNNPAVDEIFSYGKLKHQIGSSNKIRAAIKRIKMIFRMRHKKFDLAILAKSSFDPHGLRMAKWSGARHIFGYADEMHTQELSDSISALGNDNLHEVEAVGRLLDALGSKAIPGPLKVYPDQAYQAGLVEKLSGKDRPQHLIALHLSAREATRRWPAEKFIELIKRLSTPSIGFVLFWSPGQPDSPTHPGDDPMAAKIQAETCAYWVVGHPTEKLEELIAGVACCELFIGADGGALHIAVAAGVPVVGLYENLEGKRKHWYPWNIAHRLLQPATLAVSDISVDAVAAATESLLAEISETKTDKARQVD